MDSRFAPDTMTCMKKLSASVLALSFFLAACQSGAPGAGPSGNSGAKYVHWRTHHDDSLGLSIDYPSDEFTVWEDSKSIAASGGSIAIDGIALGDGRFGGMLVKAYRTSDSRIMEHLQAGQSPEKDVKGVKYRSFTVGSNDGYGYVTQKDGTYYVLVGSGGAENPVLERMLVSLRYDPPAKK
jgi:predicted small secreted protein